VDDSETIGTTEELEAKIWRIFRKSTNPATKLSAGALLSKFKETGDHGASIRREYENLFRVRGKDEPTLLDNLENPEDVA